MRRHTVVPLGIVALLLICGAILLPGALGATTMAEEDLDVDADATVLSATLDADGDAVFALEYRIELTDDEEAAAFEELAAEIDANESTYLAQFEERFAPTVAAAADATDRDMTMEELSVETEQRFTDRQVGVVTFSFTWTQFASVDGTQLTAGDALEGLLLTEDMSLVFTWPDGYHLGEVSPSPDSEHSGGVSWNGPRDFGPDEPRVVVSTDDTAVATDDWFSVPLLVGAVIVVALALGAGGWYYRREQGGSIGAEQPSAPPDDELLSNEEQVLKLVEDRGGRMKQQEVAEALEWTDAKTSKVVGNLREAGDLESFRLGRENVLRLPTEDDEL